MRYDLTSMARRHTKRKTITLRRIIIPTSFAKSFYLIGIEGAAFWDQAVEDDLLPLYAREVSTQAFTRDDSPDRLRKLLEELDRKAKEKAAKNSAEIARWVRQLERAHASKWIQAVKVGTGIDVEDLIGVLSADREVRSHQEWASSLIRDVNASMRRSIEKEVFRASADFTPRDELAKRIQKITGLSRKRSRRIAIDQANKLAGKLDQLRMREAGIDKFIWRHSRKENYRPEHVARDGKVYKWDDRRLKGDLPKQLPFCGCTAEAHLEL